ncbi:hypothetical protein G6F68_012899 [Rhizopus microsporus]|nr:hypothetical protein G6F68_012899 [Rhizopus microsporus]
MAELHQHRNPWRFRPAVQPRPAGCGTPLVASAAGKAPGLHSARAGGAPVPGRRPLRRGRRLPVHGTALGGLLRHRPGALARPCGLYGPHRATAQRAGGAGRRRRYQRYVTRARRPLTDGRRINWPLNRKRRSPASGLAPSWVGAAHPATIAAPCPHARRAMPDTAGSARAASRLPFPRVRRVPAERPPGGAAPSPRPGHRAGLQAARRVRHDHHAAGRTRGQARRHRRLWRQDRHVRPLHRRPRADRPAHPGRDRRHADSALRP